MIFLRQDNAWRRLDNVQRSGNSLSFSLAFGDGKRNFQANVSGDTIPAPPMLGPMRRVGRRNVCDYSGTGEASVGSLLSKCAAWKATSRAGAF